VSGFSLAVDIGGTFTDAVLRRDDGACWVDKALSTPDDLLVGFFAAVDNALVRANATPGNVDDVVVHATTVVTNAIITRQGPTTTLLVTEGFRDVLYIRDEHRYDMFDPQIEFAEPLVTRDFTFGIKERVLANGKVETPVDADEIKALADEMIGKGVVSVAICLLNGYLNPENERRIRDILAEAAPDLYVSISSDVAPQIREYQRASTTALNAYTRPITEPYLRRLTDELHRRGFDRDPLIMLSNGGVLGAGMAGRFPVRMIESGPAAGALVASYFAEILGLDRVLSFDMGGTTAKACIIEECKPLVTGVFEVDRMYRFKTGSGIPVIIPSIDMIEIGAGGGSIARIDNLGLMKVGPLSAGSQPGPACYGQGGENPTVTDADLVLGLLDAGNFLGGEMALDVDGARAAIDRVAEPLGVDTEEAAFGVFQVVGESMAAAARAHATDRGIDYRGMPVLAFGGAGPVHACYVAELLGSDTVIFPPMASVLSAFGTLVTPLRLDLARGSVGALDWDRADEVIGEMATDASQALSEAGCPLDDVRFTHGADIRYAGQQNEVSVDLDPEIIKGRDFASVREAFEAAYEMQYGLRLPDMEIEIVAWRLSAHGPEVQRDSVAPLGAEIANAKGERPIRLGDGLQSSPVYDRAPLAAGQEFAGPAIIEERETTIVVLPGWRARVDDSGCIIARREG